MRGGHATTGLRAGVARAQNGGVTDLIASGDNHDDQVTTMALMTALDAGGGVAPEWVHLIPAGTFRGADGRGPYHVSNPAAVIAASMAAARGKLPLDENHSTQRAAPAGAASPARGWIVELQAREDGIWGRVQWTDEGRALVTNGAYRGISPVFEHAAGGTVMRIRSAALTNDPNLTQLATLHDNLDAAARGRLDTDDFAVPGRRALPIHDAEHVRLAWDMLGRTQGLSEAERAEARHRILTRAKSLGVDTSGWQAPAAHDTQNQGNEMDLTALRAALGADAALDDAGVIALATTRATERAEHDRAAQDRVTTLSGQVEALSTQVAEMTASGARARAEAAVDAAIRDGKPLKAVRDVLVAQHMADPKTVETLIAGMPSLHDGGVVGTIAVMDAEDGDALTEEEMTTAKAMGIDPREKARAKRLRRLGRGDEIGKPAKAA